MSTARLVWDEAAWQAFRRDLALGVLNACFDVEGEAKAITPVHGDPTQGGEFATFAPGAKPIGGTLRRSIHSAVYVDGQLLGASPAAEGAPPLASPTEPRIVGQVGSALDYAVFVHDGTVRMRARPFLITALAKVAPRIVGLVEAGFHRARNRR